MKIIYNIFIKIYPLLIYIASWWNKKAYLWIDGRRNTWKKLHEKIGQNTQPVVWMHCSSLGEFEQGRPILEDLKNKFPHYSIVLSFFSPSGFEVQKKYTVANAVVYLPMDSKANAKKWVDTIKPNLVLFVKYEFWYYYIHEVQKRKIPIALVSGIFRENQVFFKWYGSFYRSILKKFDYLFVQNRSSAELLNEIGIENNILITGDSRFDRVLQIDKTKKQFAIVEKFIGKKINVIVAGSTWKDDVEHLAKLVLEQPNLLLIVAPHNIDEPSILETKSTFKNAILYTDAIKNEDCLLNKNVLIVNTIGMLSSLYAYASICYIGGGFTKDGIHNIAEAAVYYKPIIFGKNYKKFIEAVDLKNAEGAFSFTNFIELQSIINELITNNTLHKKTSQIAGNYIVENSGATSKIMETLYAKRLLTN